jgi:hypothetical protein
MPKDILNDLKKAWVSGKQLKISRVGGKPRAKSFNKNGKNESKSQEKSKTIKIPKKRVRKDKPS